MARSSAPRPASAGGDGPRAASSRATGSVTLDDVARAAGVAPTTVSRVVNKPQLVSPDTAAHVRAVIDQLGYVPNRLAGGLASRRSRLVAAVVPTIANAMFAEVVQALGDTLSQAGYELLLGTSGYDALREQQVVDAILSRRPDGVCLTGAVHTPATRQRLQAARIPVVETWDWCRDPIDMLVGFSHKQVGGAVADYLWSRGYRRFGTLFGEDQRGQERLASLRRRLSKNGVALRASQTSRPGSTLAMGRQHMAALLESAADLDVVVCSSDTLAQGAIIEAQARGLRIPGDLAVMGFGDYEFAAISVTPISSVRVDGRAMGTQAGRYLLERIEGAAVSVPTRIDTGFEIIPRLSA